MAKEAPYVYTRTNPILKVRAGQLLLNDLAVNGGKPYVEARLQRAPNESDLSWSGRRSVISSSRGSVGRVDRAIAPADAGRIAQKINQYIFSKDAQRSGIDEEWAIDVTGTGLSVRAFFEQVSMELTTGGWCWMGVDRGNPGIDPDTGMPMARSILDRLESGDRPRWSVWPANSIPDWHFAVNGDLDWLITESIAYDSSNPLEPAKEVKGRTLWTKGSNGSGATYTTFASNLKGEVGLVEKGTISMDAIPFVLVGIPSAKPWFFDMVEQTSSLIMNLSSLHVENLVRTVYPQLVIPLAMLDQLNAYLVQQQGSMPSTQLVMELIRGLDSPFVEGQGDGGVTRYLQPSATDLEAIPNEVKRMRREMYESVGLALLDRESRQVESAEAKAFDHLDTSATLRSRAITMNEAEDKLVRLTSMIDTSWTPYVVHYPMDYDVVDFASDAQGLQTIAQLPITVTQKKVLLSAITKLLGKMVTIPSETMESIQSEIGVEQATQDVEQALE